MVYETLWPMRVNYAADQDTYTVDPSALINSVSCNCHSGRHCPLKNGPIDEQINRNEELILQRNVGTRTGAQGTSSKGQMCQKRSDRINRHFRIDFLNKKFCRIREQSLLFISPSPPAAGCRIKGSANAT